jgi:ferrous iron transport protein B
MNHLTLVGNPNCGKTTLFNALTGSNQRVGNWAGVTVEKKTGEFTLGNHSVELTDLPGLYSLAACSEGFSLDEKIAAQALIKPEIDCIINVVDACHLERHLYLTSQVIELGKPLVVVLTMMDVAQQRGINIDVVQLARQLNCPVIPIQAHKNIGLNELKNTLLNSPTAPLYSPLELDDSSKKILKQIETHLITLGYNEENAYYFACRFAESASQDLACSIPNAQLEDLEVLLADARYQKVHQLVEQCQNKKSDASEHFTARLDKIILNRFLALPLFLALMYFMFFFAINIGGAFQDFFDISTNTLFVQGSAALLFKLNAPNWLIALISNGIGKGINTCLSFIPVIAAMFFFLALLETSGYMARAAFVVDKAMRFMGLPGKSFVPMIIGFGCNVPAIMAARTLDSEQDRLLTILMSPFMSCSARLAIYAVFVAAFFPAGGAFIVFSLYLIGILMAIFTGFLLRKTYFKGESSPLILELPAYHRPSIKRLLKETNLRLRFFVYRAGKLIVPVCVLLGGLNAITLGGGVSQGEANVHSLLSLIGQYLTPVFSPMGINQDNWPATVGLLTGMLAKEVVIGSLNSLYTQMGEVSQAAASHFSVWDGLSAALWSIPHNLSELANALINPIAASADSEVISTSLYGRMAQSFDGKIGAYAYLLFVLLYIPCVSTMAVIRQEANKKWMWLSVLWSFGVAYIVAVLFYQAAQLVAHSNLSFFWIPMGAFALIAAFLLTYMAKRTLRKNNVIANT